MRAAIYTRYSSDHQREASIEDQIQVCRAHIDAEGWQLVETFADRATSGATSLRSGYQGLLEGVRANRFNIVVSEALDRLSRDQEDVAGLYKQLSFSNVKLITLAEGEITELHVGLKGTMNALYLKDLAQKTHRGMAGRIRAGKSAGGYDIVREFDAEGEPIRGQRRVNENEARVIRRIFAEYVRGISSRAIAKKLNEEGVPGPGGKLWSDYTVHGNRRRGTGIINSELYVGRLVWNRQRFVKDPNTGRRQARPNPASDWITREVQELRIIEDDL